MVFAPVTLEMTDKEKVTRFGRNLNIDSDVIEYYMNCSRNTRIAGLRILRHLYRSSLELVEKVEALIEALRELNLNIIARDLEQLVRDTGNQENFSESSYPSHRGKNSSL